MAVIFFSVSPSKICDECTTSRLGWFIAARCSSMMPEHLVDSAKIYDYYVNGFEDGKYTHRARVHVPTTPINNELETDQGSKHKVPDLKKDIEILMGILKEHNTTSYMDTSLM